MATLVRFLKKDGEVYAFFPQLNFNKRFYGNSTKTSYAHIGQHSSCSIEYAKESQNATQAEYESLLYELISIGYNDLKIISTKLK